MEYQIVYRCISLDQQGYSRAARGYVLALDRLGVDVKVQSIDVGSHEADLEDDVKKRMKELIRKPIANNKKKILIYHAQPDGVNPNQEKRNGFDKVISNTVFETTKVPASWFPNINQADAVICPSQQNVKAFKNSGVTSPIYLAPHGADTESFNPRNRPFPLPNVNDTFSFLSIFQWQHRKGPDVLLRAFWQEFKPNEKVSLILKSYWGNAGVKRDQRALINQISAYKGKMGFKDTAKIYFSPSLFSDEDLKGLYTISNCFVLPSRGEGVGLPYIESLASGIPVISTGWGGQVDFINEGNGYLVDYDLKSTHYKTPFQAAPDFAHVFTPDMEWAEPSVEDLQKKMRHVFENQKEASEKGKQGRKDMKEMSWDKGGEIIKNAVEDTLNKEIR